MALGSFVPRHCLFDFRFIGSVCAYGSYSEIGPNPDFCRDPSFFWILVFADMVSIERMELCLDRTHHADGRHTLDCRMGLVGLFLASP